MPFRLPAPAGGPPRSVHEAFERRYLALQRERVLYSVLIGLGLVLAVGASLRFADDANAARFFDRLPHVFDFVSWLVPADWNDVWRALLDLPTPNADGTEATDFEAGRRPLGGGLYVPEYLFKMAETVNIAALSTLIAFVVALPLSFLAARTLNANATTRFLVRRFLELLRAFPEIVIAGFFAAILSLGPIPAIFAVGIHTIGALGKLFFETAENASLAPDDGLKAAGATWAERMRFAILPQVLPNFTSYALLRLEINVRASTIIGAVGGGGIGEELRLAISRGTGAKALAMMLVLFLTIVAVDRVSAALRRRLVGANAFIFEAR